MTEQEAMRAAVRAWNHTEAPNVECEFSESELIGAYFWKAALQWAAEWQEPAAYQRRCKPGSKGRTG